MHHRRAIRVALPFAAALPLLWLAALTTEPRGAAPAPMVNALASAEEAAAAPDEEPPGVVRIFEATLDFVREISRSFERRDHAGVVVRLLVIVEVLIGALGIVSCVTVWGRGKADLVYRIVDVMGALFLVIALLLTASMLVWGL